MPQPATSKEVEAKKPCKVPEDPEEQRKVMKKWSKVTAPPPTPEKEQPQNNLEEGETQQQ